MLQCVTKRELCFYACGPPARRVLTPIKTPLNKMMGMGVHGYGNTECFQGASELERHSGHLLWPHEPLKTSMAIHSSLS